MKKIISILISIVIVCTNCSPAKMALDTPGWAQHETLTVSGKKGLFSKERMHFGEYRTTAVKRSWIKGSGSHYGLGTGIPGNHDYTNIISLNQIRKKQTIRFSLTDEHKNLSEVYCVSKFNATGITVGNNPNSIFNVALDLLLSPVGSNTYYVQLYHQQGERPWEMLIDNDKSQQKPRSYIGYLNYSRDRYYTIHPVYKMENKNGKASNILFGAVGFEFRNSAGKPVAAVSTLNKGVVYLQPLPANERFLLANACAALLMQDMIGG